MAREGNSNFLAKDGLIRNIYAGDQNAKTVEQAWKELEKLSKELRTKGGRVLILTDLMKIGKITLSARKKGLELIRALDFDKAALVSDDVLERQVVRVVVNLSGKSFKIKYFSNEKEAKQWILEK